MTDRIRREITFPRPPEQVWRALTDTREFGAWFGVKLESGFAPGTVARGRITQPGYEYIVFEAAVERMEPERLLCPGAGTRRRWTRRWTTRRSPPRS